MNDLMTYLQASLLCQLHARFQQHMGLSRCTRCFLMLGFGPRLGFGLSRLTAKRVHTVACNLPARCNVCLRTRRRRRRPGGGCACTGVFVPLSSSFCGPAITCLAARYSVCRPTAGRPGGGWVCDDCVVRPPVVVPGQASPGIYSRVSRPHPYVHGVAHQVAQA